MLIYRRIANSISGLSIKLMQARMTDDPEYYVKKTIIIASMTAFAIFLIIFGFTKSFLLSIFLFPIILIIAFGYFVRYVDYRIQRLNKEISKEIVFAGRFLIIELDSGVSLYATFENIGKNYDFVGIYFNEIIEKVNLGTSIEDAINETVELTPSQDLRRIFWQILNSLRTGANISNSLQSVLEQVIREQQIAISEYGRKLNPIAMFYMMIAIIVPSLGITMLMIMATFIGLKLGKVELISLAFFVGFIQFMFLAITRSNRPAVDIENE
jgi:archaeal flagellar protein FlaJ